MYAMNLVDVADVGTNYGILFCDNEDITEKTIQNRMCEIKEQMATEDIDWDVEDIVKRLPSEWNISLQHKAKRIII